MKKVFLLLMIAGLGACATPSLRTGAANWRDYKRVNFFAAGHKQVAFKVSGSMNQLNMDGVLVVKKIGEEDYDVSVLTDGAYRVLQATVSPEGIAYKYLFQDADTAIVRGLINQFLNVLLSDLGTYKTQRLQKEALVITYSGKKVKTRLYYHPDIPYPFAAKTIASLNTADLSYDNYMPADENGTVQLPHTLIYKDGDIALDMELISLH